MKFFSNSIDGVSEDSRAKEKMIKLSEKNIVGHLDSIQC